MLPDCTRKKETGKYENQKNEINTIFHKNSFLINVSNKYWRCNNFAEMNHILNIYKRLIEGKLSFQKNMDNFRK